jgi:hypothetical protein
VPQCNTPKHQCVEPQGPLDSELSSVNGSFKALLIYLIAGEATVMPEFASRVPSEFAETFHALECRYLLKY